MECKKPKHSTLEDRTEIQQRLDLGMTFNAIATHIGKDQTTVSKVVNKHLEFTASKIIHRNKHGKR